MVWYSVLLAKFRVCSRRRRCSRSSDRMSSRDDDRHMLALGTVLYAYGTSSHGPSIDSWLHFAMPHKIFFEVWFATVPPTSGRMLSPEVLFQLFWELERLVVVITAIECTVRKSQPSILILVLSSSPVSDQLLGADLEVFPKRVLL